ncbi:lipoyl(octanoyl) transferase LipB [bacterium]|nr:lipoyl(octanoyl) transferase LipB [bacterium]
MNSERTVRVIDLGTIGFREAWDLQKALFAELTARKLRNRTVAHPEPLVHYLLLCEHPPVFTLGRSGNPAHLLAPPEQLEREGIECIPIDRGGDITFHGPGQIVGYPLLDLDDFFTDIHRYLRLLEETIVLSLADFGIASGRSAGETGVWLEPEGPRARKICAMGIKASRWVTQHGFAFNHSVDLKYFNYIVPCGIQGKAVASMHAEVGAPPTRAEVVDRILYHFQALFECLCSTPEKSFAFRSGPASS